MRILLLGCLSHLGINFIKYLKESNNQQLVYIVGIDKISYCSQSYNLLENFTIDIFIQSDILKLNLEDIINTHNLDIIINCAGETHVDRSYTHFNDFVNSNILLIEKIMNAILSLGSKKIKLIHFSTDEVYGDSYINSRKETDILNPTNPYSSTKASGDMIINGFYHSYKLENQIICLRPNNLCGIYQYNDKVIPSFYNNLKQNKNVYIHGSGKQRRNFILTEDVCRIIFLICSNFSNFISLKNKYNSLKPFLNVSTDDNLGVSIFQLYILMKTILNSKSDIIFSKDRLYNDKYYMINNRVLNKILYDLMSSNIKEKKLCIEILIGIKKKSKQVISEVINQM